VLSVNTEANFSPTEATGADIWFLLDRSGSMQSIAGHVVDGLTASSPASVK
jgi:hypothetical protein